MDMFKALPLTGFIIIVAAVTWRVLYLKSKGISVSSKNKVNHPCIWAIYFLFSLLFVIFIAELASLAFNLQLSFLPKFLSLKLVNNIILIYSGAFIMLLSIFILVTTLIHFKWSLRFGLDYQNAGELITSGIFSYSRNPFFLSIDIYFVSLAIINPSLFFISMAFLTLISIHLFILKEENFLEKKYGREYIEYSNNVRRYL